MRRKRSGKSDIIIDLTSLLDVIFILLMVVLAGQQVTKMDLDAEKIRYAEEEAALKDLMKETEEKYKLYTDQTDMAEKVVLISVTAAFDEDDPKERDLKILKNGNSEPDVYHLSGGNTEEAFNRFEEKLSSYVRTEGMPVVLSIADDKEEILYRDQQKIQTVFNKLQSESGDIYVRAMGEKP